MHHASNENAKWRGRQLGGEQGTVTSLGQRAGQRAGPGVGCTPRVIRTLYEWQTTDGQLNTPLAACADTHLYVHSSYRRGMCATWIQLLDGTDRAVIATIIFTSHPGASMPTGSGTIVSTLSSTSANASALCTACSS